MRRLVPGLLLFACQQPTLQQAAHTDPRPLSLGAPGPSAARLLDMLPEAELLLGDTGLFGPDGPTGGRYVLDGAWTPIQGRRLWTHALPTPLPHSRYRAVPPGARLTRGARPLTYDHYLDERDGHAGTWETEQGAIWMSARTDPGSSQRPPVWTYAPAAERERRLHPTRSALPPAEFARIQATIGPLTRDALLLPAPGSATFTVDIAQGARLRVGVGLARPPSTELQATARMRVLQDGVELWADTVQTSDPWRELDLPLRGQAGSQLTLVSETLGDPAGDWALFGTPEIAPPPTEEGPRRVVVIGIDTLRPDHTGVGGSARNTTPHMDRFASESLVFDHAWAPAPRTRPSFRTALTGQWPGSDSSAVTLGSHFQAAGFSTAGVVANVHLIPRLGFADGYGWWNYDDSADAGPQVDRALAWLGERPNEDTLLFLHLMDPHVFYLAPEPYTDRYTGGLDPGPVPDRFNRWTLDRLTEDQKLTAEQQAFIQGRYDGEIAYMDAQLGRLFAALDEMPGRTLVAMVSDHGEEFWEHGQFEHNHGVYDEQTRVLFWIRPPGGQANGPHRVSAPTSLADLVPTLLQAAQLPRDAPRIDGLALGEFLEGGAPADARAAELADRPLPLGHMMFAREHWGVVLDGHKYILHTESGREELYDLRADPGEHSDISTTAPQDRLHSMQRALETATGHPVSAGWRIWIRGLDQPVILQFPPNTIHDAGVIDPEAGRARRANIAWGEQPEHTPGDVATVSANPETGQVHIQPGARGSGVLWISGPRSDSQATVVGSAEVLRQGSGTIAGTPALVTAGMLITPPPSGEPTDPLRSSAVDHAATATQLQQLEALGYVPPKIGGYVPPKIGSSDDLPTEQILTEAPTLNGQ